MTEWGWSSSAVGLETQAAYVRRSLEMLRDQFPYVTVATMFLDADRPGEYDDGLLTADFTPKPAGTAFAAFMHDRSAVSSTPTPSTPTPSTPTPSTPTPSTPTPSTPTPSTPTPSTLDPTPSNPTPSNPTPSTPTPSTQRLDPTPRTGPCVRLRRPTGRCCLRAAGWRLPPSPRDPAKLFAARMRVVWSHTGKSLSRGSITATARAGHRRLDLVKRGWYRSRVRVAWRVPAWAHGKTIIASITVRNRGAMITKRFSAHVRQLRHRWALRVRVAPSPRETRQALRREDARRMEPYGQVPLARLDHCNRQGWTQAARPGETRVVPVQGACCVASAGVGTRQDNHRLDHCPKSRCDDHEAVQRTRPLTPSSRRADLVLGRVFALDVERLLLELFSRG